MSGQSKPRNTRLANSALTCRRDAVTVGANYSTIAGALKCTRTTDALGSVDSVGALNSDSAHLTAAQKHLVIFAHRPRGKKEETWYRVYS